MFFGIAVPVRDWTLIAAREKIYAQGGILSVTSRILVVDMLSSMYMNDQGS